MVRWWVEITVKKYNKSFAFIRNDIVSIKSQFVLIIPVGVRSCVTHNEVQYRQHLLDKASEFEEYLIHISTALF
jgi:hypothetical protein